MLHSILENDRTIFHNLFKKFVIGDPHNLDLDFTVPDVNQGKAGHGLCRPFVISIHKASRYGYDLNHFFVHSIKSLRL